MSAAPHIVVVDDEPLFRETACRILRRAGFETRDADSAETALDLIDDATSLLVTDTALGGMSGPELRARVLETRPDLPVLLMSGMESDELEHWGVQTGQVAFLAKPFEASELVEAVQRTMRGG
jgi:two-component system cell cycle sensor histidine kinase/response regulator CckA